MASKQTPNRSSGATQSGPINLNAQGAWSAPLNTPITATRPNRRLFFQPNNSAAVSMPANHPARSANPPARSANPPAGSANPTTRPTDSSPRTSPLSHESESPSDVKECPLKQKVVAKGQETSFSIAVQSLTAFSSLFESIVIIEAVDGDHTKTFHLHKGLLSLHSSFFNAAFNSSFKEGQDNLIKLDERPEIVEAFMVWLYTGRMESRNNFERHTKDLQRVNDVYHFLIDCWIFGDKRVAPGFQNEALDRFIEVFVSVWKAIPNKTILYAFASTMPDSPVQRVVVDLMFHTCPDIACYAQTALRTGTFPPVAFLLSLLELVATKPPPRLGQDTFHEKFDKCAYHIHELPTAKKSPD